MLTLCAVALVGVACGRVDDRSGSPPEIDLVDEMPAADPEFSSESPLVTVVPGAGEFPTRGELRVSPHDGAAVLALQLSGERRVDGYMFAFGVTLDNERAQALATGDWVVLDGSASFAWGPQGAEVARFADAVRVEQLVDGVKTLRVKLGAEVRVESAPPPSLGSVPGEVVTTGRLPLSCAAPVVGRDPSVIKDDVRLETTFCKDAVAMFGLEGLIR